MRRWNRGSDTAGYPKCLRGNDCIYTKGEFLGADSTVISFDAMKLPALLLAVVLALTACQTTPTVGPRTDTASQVTTTETQAEEASGEAAEQDEAAEQEEDPEQSDADDVFSVLGVLAPLAHLAILLAHVF